MKILLHSCCAPCTIYPLKHLRGEGHRVNAYFYNPNIHPYTEFRERKQALEKFAEEEHLDLAIEKDYGLEEYLALVTSEGGTGTGEEERKKRCSACYRLRLEKAAEKARETGADTFTSTLLVSPWQDQELIRETGYKIGEQKGIPFYYVDFRPGYREAQQEAWERGIYRQKYCGCIFSEMERYVKKK